MISPQSLQEFAQIIQTNKPYLVELENTVQEVQHGKIIVEIDVRSGSVDKMVFKEVAKNWLREKAQTDNGQTIITFAQSFQIYSK